MAIICIFFPAIIMCTVRKKIWRTSDKDILDRIGHCIVDYAKSCIILNLFLLLVLVIFRHNIENIYDKLNQYSSFAIKYLALSMIMALISPYIEQYFKEKIIFSFEIGKCESLFSDRFKRIAVIIFVAAMFLLHFIRIFDNSFWGDEGIAINAAHMTWIEMLENIAMEGHSPFHYGFLWITCKIFGYSGTIYHFVSLIPYMIILAVALILIWKWFGAISVIIFTVLSSLLENAVCYNLEVRMYSWCQMFILLAYLATYRLLQTRKGRYYIYLMLSALGAIYCHYFALASIGILYLSIFIYLYRTHIKDIGKLIISGCGLLVGGLPWILFCYRTKGQVMTDYHISEVSLKECFKYIFDSKYSLLLLGVFMIVWSIVLLCNIGVFGMSKTNNEKIEIKFNFNIHKYTITDESVWIFSGVCAVFGMIMASKIISSLVFPIIVLRYLYPSFIIIWLLMGICISKCPLKRIATIALMILVIVSCFPVYLRTVKTERLNNKRLENTLLATKEIDRDAYITTNIGHFNWTVSQVYYPDTPHRLCSNTEFPEFDSNIDNWLFLSQPISDDAIKSLESQKYVVKAVIENGFIGTGNVWIYKIVGETE